jgi:hypothetical protein
MDLDKLVTALADLFRREYTQADFALCGPSGGGNE